MKRIIVLYLGTAFILLSGRAPVKLFEGEVDYDVSYEIQKKTVDINRLGLMFGIKEQFFISGARYKSMTDGQLIEMQLYDPASNRLYTKVPESDTLVYFDAGANRDSVTGFSIRPNADTVLGHTCQALSFTSVSGSATYFFSADFPVYAAGFRGHHFANWAFYCDKAKAVPLKMIIRNPDFTMTAVATVIRPIRLDSLFFQVPAGLQVPGKN